MFRTAAALVVALSTIGSPAQAATVPGIIQLDISKGQQPENLVLEPDGSVDLDFGFTGQLAKVSRTGRLQITGQIRIPDNGDVPVTHGRIFLGGIVRCADGTRYLAVSTGTADQTGIYRIRDGHQPIRVAALPPTGFYNGMALDEPTGQLYVADSVQSTVWRVPLHGGSPTAWATGDALAPVNGFGANGLKIHDGGVWVSNIGAGTLVRIPLDRPARFRTVASGLGPIDDFAFTGHGDTVIAAVNQDNKVLRIEGNGTFATLLTSADGLSNPTAVAVRGGLVYITNAAYFTGHDPSLMIRRL